jgi:hypothetical protein
VTVNVAPASTGTQLTSSASVAAPGQPVTFTATVSNTSGTGVIPIGSVQFAVNDVPLGAPVLLDATGRATSPATSFAAETTATITATYLDPAGNFAGSSSSLSQVALYNVVTLYDPNRPVHSGATLPIKIQLTDGSGQTIGSAALTVTADSVLGPGGSPVPLQSPGSSQPGNLFRYDPVIQSYQFNVKTTGYLAGQYTLCFSVGDDPTLYTVTFLVR